MICPFCAEEIKDQAILCRFCGKDLPGKSESSAELNNNVETQDDESVIHTSKRSPISKLKSLSKAQKIIAISLVAVLFIGGGGIGFNKFSAAQEKKRIAAEEAAALQAEIDEYSAAVKDYSWVPSGFTKFSSNPYMAYKKNKTSCNSYGACFPFDLITSKYCDSVYISANMEENGYVVDFSNDSANGIAAGKIVKMKIQWTEDSGDNVEWVDATCR
jgi:hypothetical protein